MHPVEIELLSFYALMLEKESQRRDQNGTDPKSTIQLAGTRREAGKRAAGLEEWSNVPGRTLSRWLGVLSNQVRAEFRGPVRKTAQLEFESPRNGAKQPVVNSASCCLDSGVCLSQMDLDARPDLV